MKEKKFNFKKGLCVLMVFVMVILSVGVEDLFSSHAEDTVADANIVTDDNDTIDDNVTVGDIGAIDNNDDSTLLLDETDILALAPVDQTNNADELALNLDGISYQKGSQGEITELIPGTDGKYDASQLDTNDTYKFNININAEVVKDPDTGRTLKKGDYFTIKLTKGFKLLTGVTEVTNVPIKEWVDGKEVEIATYSITIPTEGSDIGSCIITVTFSDCVTVYTDEQLEADPAKTNYYDISCGLNFSLELDNSALSNEAVTNSLIITGAALTDFILPVLTKSYPSGVKKEGIYNTGTDTSQDARTIDWSITAGSDKAGRSLTGYTLNDIIDTEKMDFVSASIKDGENLTPINGDAYSNGTFNYTFMEGTLTPQTIVIRTRLKDTAFMDAGGNLLAGNAPLNVKNKASLNPPAENIDNAPIQWSNETIVDVPHDWVQKIGEQISASVMRWTIEANVGENAIYRAEVQDYLDDRLTPKGKVIIRQYQKGSSTEIASEKDYTIQSANNTNEPVCVVLENGITTKKVLNVYFNQPIYNRYQIEFNTEVDTATFEQSSVDVTNTVNMKVSFPLYEGPNPGGPWLWGVGDASLKFQNVYVTKNCEEFDRKTGLITWSIRPTARLDYDNYAYITDPISSGQTFNKIESITVKGQPLTEDEIKSICTYDDSGKILTIHLGDKRAGSGDSIRDFTLEDINSMVIKLKTKSDTYGSNEPNKVYTNRCELYWDSTMPKYGQAETIIGSLVIDKTGKFYYDKTDKKSYMLYTIDVNSNGMTLEDAIVKDNLDQIITKVNGTAVNGITWNADTAKTKVVTLENGTETDTGIKANEVMNGDGNREVQIKFGSTLESSARIYLYLTPADKNALFSMDGAISVLNKATIEGGGIVSSDNQYPSSGNPEKTDIDNKLIKKSNPENYYYYNDSEGEHYVKWNIAINNNEAVFGDDLTVQDTLPKGVDLNTETLKLYESVKKEDGSIDMEETLKQSPVKMSSDGSLTYKMAMDKDEKTTFQVPVQNDGKAYTLTYQTDIVDRVGLVMSNDAKLLKGAVSISDYKKSAAVSSGNHGTLSTRTTITINKVDYDEPDGNRFIAGAKFELYSDAAGTKLLKVGTTNSKGQVVFRGLKRNMTYYLKEIEAAQGYQLVNQSPQVIQINTDAVVKTIANKRITADVHIEKYGQDNMGQDESTIIGDVHFQLFYTYKGKTYGVKLDSSNQFDSYVNTDSSGTDYTYTTVSNQILEFKGLPWGEYYLKEVETSDNTYGDTDKKYAFILKCNTDNSIATTFNSEFASTSQSGNETNAGIGVIQNKRTKLTVNVFSNGDKKAVDGVSYEIKQKDTDGNYQTVYTVEQGDSPAIDSSSDPGVGDSAADNSSYDNKAKEVVIYTLEKGEYQIVFDDTTIPDEYLLPDDGNVTLKSEDSITIELYEVKGLFVFDKYTTKSQTDTDPGTKRLSGVSFDLFKVSAPDDVLIAEGLKTDSSGKYSSRNSKILRVDAGNTSKKLGDGLEYGEYYLVETGNDSPLYQVDSTPTDIFSVNRTTDRSQRPAQNPDMTLNGEINLGKFTNRPWDISLEIQKVDANDGTMGVIGTKFELYREDESGAWEKYTQSVTDTDAKNGLFTSRAKDSTYNYTDSYGTSQTYTPSEDGGAFFYGLIPGYYQIREIVSDKDNYYELPSSADFEAGTFTVDASDAGTTIGYGTIDNYRKLGKLTFKKTEDNGITPMKDVAFELFMYNGSDWDSKGEFITGNEYADIYDTSGSPLTSEGTLTINGLDWGAYYLLETNTKEGFILDTKKYGFVIGNISDKPSDIAYKTGTSSADKNEITADLGIIKNIPTKITIKKIDSVTKQQIAGAEIEINAVDSGEGFATESFTTGTTEKKLSASLKEGKQYTITETLTPEHYKDGKSGTSYTFSIKEGANGQIEPVNTWDSDYITLTGSVGNQVITIINEPVVVEVAKLESGTDDTYVEGAELTIFEADASGNATATQVYNWTTGSKKEVLSAKLSINQSYVLRETKTPIGYKSTEDIPFSIDADGNITANSAANGNLLTMFNEGNQLTITAVDGDEASLPKLPETTFELSGTGLDSPLILTSVGLEQLPHKVIKKLQGGESYTLTTIVPNGYETVEDAVIKMNKDGNAVYVKNNAETPIADNNVVIPLIRKSGNLTLIKVDGTDNTMVIEGAEFKLYKENASLEFVLAAVDSIVNAPTSGTYDSTKEAYLTGADGKLTITGMKWGTYKLVESKPKDGYVNENKEYPFTINAANLSKDLGNVVNNKACVTLKKVDADSNNAPLSGAVFALMDADEPNDNIVTDATKADGTIKLEAVLVEGKTYILTEKTAPNGYKKSNVSVKFKVIANNVIEMVDPANWENWKDIVTVVGTEITVRNHMISVNVANKDSSGTAYVEEAELTVYEADADGNAGTVLKQWTTADKEESLLNLLITGKPYILRETITPFGYITPKDIAFFVDDEGNLIVNGDKAENNLLVMKNQENKITVNAKDKDSEVLLSGAEFILSGDGKDSPFEKEWISEDTGTGGEEFIKLLKGGSEYILTIHKAPQGYEEVLPITAEMGTDGVLTWISGDNVRVENNRITVLFTQKKAQVELLKVDGTDESNTPLDETKFQLYKKGTADDTWNLMDVTASENSFIVEKGSYDAGTKTLTTGSGSDMGMLAIKNMSWGSYKLVETKAKDGFVKDAVTDQYFTLDAQNLNKNLGKIMNVKTKVSIVNIDAITKKALAGSKFTIKSVPSEGDYSFTTSESDTSGAIAVTGNLIEGNTYTLEETTTPSEYKVSGVKVTFKVKDGGSIEKIGTWDSSVTLSADGIITVENTPISIFVEKKNADDSAFVSGAELTIFSADKKGNATEDAVTVWTTQKQSHPIQTLLKRGETYVLSETKTPIGYITAKDIVFSISDKAELVTDGKVAADSKLTMKNIENAMSVAAVDEKDNITRISGAEYTLNGTGLPKDITFTSSKELADIIGKLSGGGDYTIKETKAPAGYFSFSKSILFTMSKDGIVTLNNETGTLLKPDNTLFIPYKRSTGSVSLIKEGNTKDNKKIPLAGTAFQLYQKDKEGAWKLLDQEGEQFKVTKGTYNKNAQCSMTADGSDAGKLILSDLYWGEYKLVEIIPTKGYAISETEYPFTINEDSIDVDLGSISNELTKVLVSREDGSGNQIGSGILELLDNKGNVVKEWTGSKTVVEIFLGNLTAGETYTVREKTAPGGYNTAGDKKFTLSMDGIVRINDEIIKDNHVILVGPILAAPPIIIPPTPAPEETPKPEETQKPEKTPKPEKTQKPEKTEKPEKSEKPTETQKPDKPEDPSNTASPSKNPRAVDKVAVGETVKEESTLTVTKKVKNVQYTLYDQNNNVVAVLTTDENGTLDFSDVEPGSYTLVLKTVPKGYETNASVYEVEVSDEDGKHVVKATRVSGTKYNDENVTVTLPKTGTMQTWVFYVGGMLLILLGFILVFFKKRVRK